MHRKAAAEGNTDVKLHNLRLKDSVLYARHMPTEAAHRGLQVDPSVKAAPHLPKRYAKVPSASEETIPMNYSSVSNLCSDLWSKGALGCSLRSRMVSASAAAGQVGVKASQAVTVQCLGM